MGIVPLAPDFPSIVIWATIAFMFIGGMTCLFEPEPKRMTLEAQRKLYMYKIRLKLL